MAVNHSMLQKVFYVTRGIPTDQNPLLGIFEFDQAQALAAEGIDVTYLVVDLRSIRRKRKLGIACGVKNGIRWYSISVPVGAVSTKLLCKIGALALRILYKKVSKEVGRPDVLHAHFSGLGCMASVISLRENIPLVITEHSSLMNENRVDKHFLECAIQGYHSADKVITVSHPLAESIRKKTNLESVVIPNVIDIELFASCSHRAHTGFRVVTTSNLIQRKRTIVLLQAMKNLVSLYSDCHLDIIGDGPMKAELESYVMRYGLKDNVSFLGRLSREEVTKVYEKEDCFALLSECETFGVVYAEAMAAGLPVIATRCGGPEDFVNEKNGILVDVNDVEQTVSALEKIRSMGKSLYDESQIRMTAARFSKKNIAGELLRLYSAIIDEKQEG